jgi:3-dehydroquinate dehydratase II
MKKILVIHGPNLNLLGSREIDVYGSVTIEAINAALAKAAPALAVCIDIIQSNHEGDIVTAIGEAPAKAYHGIVINPAAYTHTSIAILDALKACSLPCVEVHLSNIYAREEFRHKSITAQAAIGQVCGFGLESYLLGLRALADKLSRSDD